MELRQLEHLLAVAESGSLTAAAERVGLTQQAISKSLSRLGDSLGGKLIERHARGIVLTRLGHLVAEYAREVLLSSRRLRAAAAEETGSEHRKLIIGVSPIAATSIVGRQVARFASDHPDLRIDVETGTDRRFFSALHQGHIDLALAAQTEILSEDLLVEQIALEPWGVVGRRGNPLLDAAKDLSDLAGAQWIAGSNMGLLDEIIDEHFAAAGIAPPQADLTTSSVVFALTTLAQSDYLSILPRALSGILPDLVWRDFSAGAWSLPIFLMRCKRTHLSRVARQLLAVLTAA